MAKTLRGFVRKDLEVVTHPAPRLALNKYIEHPDISNNQIRWNIFAKSPKTTGQDVLLCSMQYLRYSQSHTPESIVCNLTMNEAYVRDKEKKNLTREFCENVETLAELIKLHHPKAKEILFCSLTEAPSEFVRMSLTNLAKENNREMKTRMCTQNHLVFDKATSKHIHKENKLIGFALQI